MVTYKLNKLKLIVLLGMLTFPLMFFQNCSGGFSAGGTNSLTSASVAPPPPSNSPSQYSSGSYTGWPLQFIGIDLTTAYPNIEYYSRFAVTGGLYPYTFQLLQAPTGMQIQSRTGEIKWTPTQVNTSANVEVQVTDSLGTTATHALTINVTTSGFYFIDATKGNDSNAGTITAPFQTLLGVQGKALPMTATLYFRAGTYPSTGVKMNEMPGLWMAYPGDTMPALDCQNQETCVGLNGLIKNTVLFQGFEIENSSFKFFWLDGDSHGVTWRNNIMHDIHVTDPNAAYENPAFIFTSDYSGSTSASTDIYHNLILQNNEIYNLYNYLDPTTNTYDIHISSATFYDVSYSLEEDDVIHDVHAGTCIEDKDGGWYNTYRHNTCYNISGNLIGLYDQGGQGQIEVENNLLVGDSSGRNAVEVGSQPSYIQNIYIHNNTIVDASVDFRGPIYGQAPYNYIVGHNIFYDDSSTAPYPFYTANSSYDPSQVGQPIGVGSSTLISPQDAFVTCILTGKEVQMIDNLYWSPDPTQNMITWDFAQKGISLAGYQKLNIDTGSTFFTDQPGLSTDGTYSLSPSDPNYGVYGKDFGAGSWQ